MTKALKQEVEKYLSKKMVLYKKFSPELEEFLSKKYSQYNLPIKLQWLLYSTKSKHPTCQFDKCKELVTVDKKTKTFSRGCCQNHSQKITFKENFGTDHPLKNKKQQDKLKKSVQDKYGVDSIAQLNSTKQKIKDTTQERYNVDSIAELDSTKQKIKDTMLARYGVEHAQQSKSIRLKTKKTNLSRFGVEEPLSDPIFRAKANETNIERYGSIFPMRNEELLKKRQEHIVEKYDAYSPNTVKIDINKYHHLDNSLEAENNNEVYYYFFEDELNNKVKQIDWIKNQDIKIIIQETEFRNISHIERDNFIAENSLYPKDTDYRQNYGVFSDESLIAIFSGYEKEEYYEITRFVIKMGISIKNNILKSFLKYINKDKPIIISFDRRFTPLNQLLLDESGFEFVGGTEPKKHFENIWDCGKLVYKLY